MIDFLEALMILCWGVSWPISLHKSWTSRTAKGKSVVFEVFIWLGYACGIVRKVLQLQMDVSYNWLFYMALIFYLINMTMVTLDMIIWRRNWLLDRRREEANEESVSRQAR